MGNLLSPETNRLEITISKLRQENKELCAVNRDMLNSHKQEQTRLINEVNSYIRKVSEEKETNKLLQENVQRLGRENMDSRQQINKEKEENKLLREDVRRLEEMRTALSQIDGIVDRFGHC